MEKDKTEDAKDIEKPVRRRRRKQEEEKKPATSLAGKLFFKIVVTLLAIAIVAGAVFYGGKAFIKITREQKHTRLTQELEHCRELVSVKMRYSEIVSLKRKAAGGLVRSYSIVRFSGVVRAGIADISDAQIEIGSNGKSVSVILPRPEILGNEIVSQEVYDEQQSIFRSVRITTEEIFDGIDAARKDVENKLVVDGIITEAAEQACKVVKAVFVSAGFSDVEVRTN